VGFLLFHSKPDEYLKTEVIKLRGVMLISQIFHLRCPIEGLLEEMPCEKLKLESGCKYWIKLRVS
jgi:hypothetical protein